MADLLEDLRNFIDTSPTSWHAALQVSNRLALQEFIPLDEKQKWELEPGQKYFVLRGGSICAFCLPKSLPTRALILAAHTDSPALKIKPHPEIVKNNMIQLGVEVYGGPLLSSWLNRDLGIAGRIVITDTQNQIQEKLIDIDEAPLFIPQLAIHLDREVNEKGLILNKQDHLAPIAALSGEQASSMGYLEKLLRRHLSFHDLISFDLFLTPLEKFRFVGENNEMIASYRLDNLASVHAATAAISTPKEMDPALLQMAVFWDHEEIGSKTAEGASSPFLCDLLKRIAYCLKIDEEALLMLKNDSLCVSIDMGHALNPNYVKKHDPNHQPLLGKGIVVKYNADHKYASDAFSSARIIHTCKQHNLNYQSYVNRSDLPSGSTVGPIVAQGLGIPTVDIGIAQLSMHSAREVIASLDYLNLYQLLFELLKT